VDGAVDFFDMEEGSADAPPTPNASSNAGCSNPPPMFPPLTIYQFWTVSQETANDEGQGTEATVDKGFGIQVDQLEHTPVSFEGLLNASFFPNPIGVSLVSQVQSPSSDMVVGEFLFDD